MKNFILGLLFSVISLEAGAALSSPEKVTLTAREKTTKEVVQELSRLSGVEIHIPANLSFTKQVSIDVKETNLEDVLNFIATEQGTKWERDSDNSIRFVAL